MDPTWTGAVLTAFALLAATGWQLHTRTMRRALDRERAAARLTEATHHRDQLAFQQRIDTASRERAVLAAADAVLTQALTIYATSQDPKEGGTP